MSWTGAQLAGFARGILPTSAGNIRIMNTGLPDTRLPDVGQDGKYSLDDYHVGDVAREFRDFTTFVRGHEIGQILNPDYWDGNGDFRGMRQLGGHFGRNSVHLSHRSDTTGKPTHRYNMVFGHEGQANAEAIAWRNFSGVAMSPAWSRLITGASFFVASAEELYQRFGGQNAKELAKNIFVAQNGGQAADVKLAERSSTEPKYVGNALIASSKFYTQLGQVEIASLPWWSGHFLVVINNTVSHQDWTRQHAQNGLVAVNDGPLLELFRDRAGRPEYPQAESDWDRISRTHNPHDVFSWLNRGVWQATGVGT